jgi:O6-methylguanine-DNA--protein-cysteine methyltransferase
MTTMSRECREIEPDLIAVATAEAPAAAARRVERHVESCASCRSELARYQTVDGLVTAYRDTRAPEADPTLARAQLESRLADLRSRVMRYGVFDSPLGPIAIGVSEHGVSMVEYVRQAERTGGRLARRTGEEAVEDPRRTEGLYRELADYLDGRRTRLDWPLDLRRTRSDFQRRVLEATAHLPYGAVTSYAGIARQIGAPRATRAVAQALPPRDWQPGRPHRVRRHAHRAQARPARGGRGPHRRRSRRLSRRSARRLLQVPRWGRVLSAHLRRHSREAAG